MPLAAFLLAGCVAKTFAEPELIGGTEDTVSIKGGSWRNAEPLARRYCARFGRAAVPTGSGAISRDRLTSIYTFDCVDRSP